jgi:serine/threonine-protein kinase
LSVPNAQLAQALSDRYQIEREIGAGGMATVYLAQDLRHDRKVAVKVLRPELAAIIGGERFLHDIRTTANQQHPHILPLHDSGEAGGSVFYVMPFVQGQSLRDRLATEKQLPVDEAVRITREVASALDYAHRHGVVHRDIKPENILLHDGQALVADFGIALAVSRSDGGTRMTETGMSLGTPHYMAPEQAMGEREISARADVYALGCVLYECLVGEPPFTGPTAQAIIARVMTDSPRSLGTQRHTIPAHVEAAVRTALEKLPADRFASAAAFSEALGNASFGLGTGMRPAYAGGAVGAASWDPRQWGLPTRVFAGLALVFAALAIGMMTRNSQEDGERPVVAFTLLDSSAAQTSAIVNDAGAVAWPTSEGIRLRRPGQTESELLAGTADADQNSLTFSPDGAWIAYTAPPTGRAEGSKGAIRKIALAGGGPQPISNDLPAAPWEFVTALRWETDGQLYLSLADLRQRVGFFFRMSEAGGALDTLLRSTAVYPIVGDVLPGSRHALITLVDASNTGDLRIVAVDLTDGDTTFIAPAAAPTFTRSGHLLYVRPDGTLQATLFDPRTLKAQSAATVVQDSVSVAPPFADYALSANGTLVYTRGPVQGAAGGGQRPVFVRPNGSVQRISLPTTDHPDGDVSPDGRYLAYTRRDQIWLYDLDVGTHWQLTHGGSGYHNPVWSPDGKAVLFRASREGGGPGDAYVQAVDSATPSVRISSPSVAINPAQWLSDGTVLAYSDVPSADVFRSSADGKAPLRPILNADWAERGSRVSPDGKWLAYQSNETGQMRLYVRSWPELRDKQMVSDAAPRPASSPVWSADSRTIYFQEGSHLVAATIAPGDQFRVTGRRVLADSIGGPILAQHPDGRLFGFLPEVAGGTTGPVRRRVVVVAHWDQVLQRAVSPR